MEINKTISFILGGIAALLIVLMFNSLEQSRNMERMSEKLSIIINTLDNASIEKTEDKAQRQ